MGRPEHRPPLTSAFLRPRSIFLSREGQQRGPDLGGECRQFGRSTFGHEVLGGRLAETI